MLYQYDGTHIAIISKFRGNPKFSRRTLSIKEQFGVIFKACRETCLFLQSAYQFKVEAATSSRPFCYSAKAVKTGERGEGEESPRGEP